MLAYLLKCHTELKTSSSEGQPCMFVNCTHLSSCHMTDFFLTGTEDKRIVGTGMVSFNVKSRSQFMTCRPPPSALFLTNMAVSREYQRQGIASQILKTCEDYCRTHRPERIMCLQVRWKDAPARKLYQYVVSTCCLGTSKLHLLHVAIPQTQ